MNALDLLYLPVAAIAAPIWARKSRADWPARFGRTPALPPSQGRKRLLIHAVSVGEVNTLRGLVPLLKPHVDVVISVGTDTGIARARALFADEANPGAPAYLGAAKVVRYPLDLSSAVRRFWDSIRPDAVALVELELWPNFLREARKRDVPVAVINGRLSPRSFKGYSRVRRFFRPLFAQLAFAAVQDVDYAQRFIHMGAPSDRVHVTGSMKWDSVNLRERALGEVGGTVIAGQSELAAAMGIDSHRPLVVAGSTGPLTDVAINGTPMPGEEALLHAACPPGTQLLCAPRKPERFDEAFAQLGGASACVRRSALAQSPAQPGSHNRFLLDTIGELRAAYAMATVAVVGRSFGGLHGSDPIEPISLNIPTVIGPHFSDFSAIVQSFRLADAIEIADAQTLRQVFSRLLNDPARREQLVENGRACIRANQGATARHAEMLLGLMNVSVPK